ncbi:MAG: restriction endonuclease subunit S [Treponemataceae bacterium]|nr:restriction endonuclease subunit S [Treponemataceae bacterium]
MKEDWKECKLGEVCDFQNGYAFKSSEFKSDGEYKVVKIKELKDGLVKFFDDSAYVDSQKCSDFDKFVIEKNDVIFALTGDPVSKPNPLSWVGRVSIYRNSEKAVLNQRTCKVKKSNNFDNVFLYYYFRQWENFYGLASKATGSASQANISTNTIADTIINLPPLATQQKIATILSSLDDKIELNNKINDNLEQQAQAIFKSWFVDFEPFGGKMPEGWRVGKLSEIADYLNGLAMQKLIVSSLVRNFDPEKSPKSIMLR